MKKLEDLLPLEKEHTIDHFCMMDYIADNIDERENVRRRIVCDRRDGRYFYNEMKDGETVKCFEMMLDRKPFDGVSIFAFTPDNIHICTMDSRAPGKIDWLTLKDGQIESGMSFNYHGNNVTFIDDSHIGINGNAVLVEKDSSYAYKCLKRKIKANGGARGLFAFMENSAKIGLFYGPMMKIFEMYS